MSISEKVMVNVSISPPLVYFDTCAYDLFFKPEYLKELERFVNLMNNKGATLMVSWANVAELGGRLNDGQIEEICSLLNKIETRPIEVEPNKVIGKERAIVKEGKTFLDRYLPIVCEEIMEWSEDVSNWEEIEGIYSYPRMASFLRKHHYASKGKQLKNHFDGLRMQIEDIHKNKLKIKDIKATIQKRLKEKISLKGKNKLPYFTEEIYSLANRFVLRSNKESFKSDSAWFDLCHVIVPATYCNIIILDGRWKHFVTQILKNYGLKYPNIAKAFVFNNKDVETLLGELEHSLVIP